MPTRAPRARPGPGLSAGAAWVGMGADGSRVLDADPSANYLKKQARQYLTRPGARLERFTEPLQRFRQEPSQPLPFPITDYPECYK